MNKPALTQKELNLWKQSCLDNNEAVFNKYCEKAYRHDIMDETYYHFAVEAYGHTLYNSNKVLFKKLFDIMEKHPKEQVYYTQKLAGNILSQAWIFDFIKNIPTDLKFTENVARSHLSCLKYSPVSEDKTNWILQHSQPWQIEQCLNACVNQHFDHLELILPYAQTNHKIMFLLDQKLNQVQVDLLVDNIGLAYLQPYKERLKRANKDTFAKVIAQLDQIMLMEHIASEMEGSAVKRKSKI